MQLLIEALAPQQHLKIDMSHAGATAHRVKFGESRGEAALAYFYSLWDGRYGHLLG